MIAGSWLTERHSLATETGVVLALYGAYEGTRAAVAGSMETAIRHADDIVSIEQHTHLYAEHLIQRTAASIPGLIGAFGLLYLTLHLAVTGGYLVWLHRRRPANYPLVRNTVLLASGLALVGYLVFPTAPPRLAGIGISDTVSTTHVDLNHGLVSSLYNPVAAVPSMHAGYALIVGVSLFQCARRRALRAAAVLYPVLVLAVIVATGNHFLFDAVTGALVVALAYGIATLVRAPTVAKVDRRIEARFRTQETNRTMEERPGKAA